MARSSFSSIVKLRQLEDHRVMRRIIAEDLDWTLVLIPSLSTLCLQSIVRNFEEYPIYEKLTPTQKDFVHEQLSTSLKLHVTANLISDGIYWKRRCEKLWDLCDVSDYGHSWKRMFFERRMADMIENFIPNVTDPKTVLEMVPLCETYVKKLAISQLLPPIKEAKKEEDTYVSESESDNENEGPPMDHFEFHILLHRLTNLKELHLVYAVKQCGMNFEWNMFEMTDRDCESLGKALKSCTTLKLLKLHQSHVEDKRCRKLVRYLLDHPTLRELDFSHNLIGDRGARAIGKLLNNSKLQTLNMCDNVITGPGAKAIAHALSKNSTLLSLNLRLNHLRDEGGEAIAKALLNNHSLRHLHLGANEVTEVTAIALAKVLFENKTLRSINLSCNRLGVNGGKALEEAIAYTSLTDCDVRLTDVDEASVNSINQVVWTNQSLKLENHTEEIKTT